MRSDTNGVEAKRPRALDPDVDAHRELLAGCLADDVMSARRAVEAVAHLRHELGVSADLGAVQISGALNAAADIAGEVGPLGHSLRRLSECAALSRTTALAIQRCLFEDPHTIAYHRAALAGSVARWPQEG